MKKNGITMVALIVTIAIIIILVTASLSTIINKRYFSKADEMNFSSNFDNYKNELEDYIGEQDVLGNGRYNSSKLFADAVGIYYNGEVLENQTIKNIIPTISDEFINNIKVYQGRLVYTGENVEYRNKVNGLLSYLQEDILVELESSSVDDLDYPPIEISANIQKDFSIELVYRQLENSYEDGKKNFIYSDVFSIYETSKNGNIYFETSASEGEELQFALRNEKTDKITFTYDSKEKIGKIYINGIEKMSKEFSSGISSFNKIYISGDREYYSLRVYDKCLNYSEIKQNDIKDMDMYGTWEEI